MRVRKTQHHDRSSTRESDTSGKCTPSSSSAGNTILDGLALIQRGNEYFFSDCYLEATGYYYQAAMVLKSSQQHRVERSKAWSNVAECHLRLKNWQAAEDASTNALGADPANSKARYRRAKARFELGDYKGAAQDADGVGTDDAMDVAALCRELAHAEIAQKLTASPGAANTRERMRRTTSNSGTRQPVEEERRDSPPVSPVRPTTMRPAPQSLEERDLWFRRIIDSYRLRVDDEYTKAGAADAGCLYGIRAKGEKKSPIDHFQAYVQRAIKKRVLPPWFLVGDMEELCRMATTDTFSNINLGVTPEEIMEFYTGLAMGMRHDELHELRNLAVFIEGPIGMPWTEARINVAPEKHTRSTPKRTKSVPRVISEPVRFQKTTSFDLNHNSDYSPEMHVGHIFPVQKEQQSGGNGNHHQHHTFHQTVEHREEQPLQNSFRKLQRAPSDTRQPRTAPSIPVSPKRNSNVVQPHHQSDKIHGRYTQPNHLHAEQEHQQQAQAGPSYPPRCEKGVTGRVPVKQQSGYRHPTRMNHQHQQHQHYRSETHAYGMSSEMRPLSMPVVHLSYESDSSATEHDSYGPQLPYQASMLSQGYTKRPVGTELPYYGSNAYREYDSQEDTSTAQEVRHGLGYRDEFSELTELSP